MRHSNETKYLLGACFCEKKWYLVMKIRVPNVCHINMTFIIIQRIEPLYNDKFKVIRG